MELAYNLKGAARKELGEVLTEYTGMECIYNGVPTCSYSVGDFTITKAGTLVLPEDWDDQDAEDLLAFLSAKGYHAADGSLSTNDEATTTEYTVEGLSVTIPADTMTDDAVINLENLLCAKGDLIWHALQAENVDIVRTEDAIVFDWIHRDVTPKEAAAYTRFVSALCEMAKTQKRISPHRKDVENEKYAFRCFLLRLGFIGEQFKDDRKELLKYLSGNSAFKEVKER